jgi:hypothetical protein
MWLRGSCGRQTEDMTANGEISVAKQFIWRLRGGFGRGSCGC